MHKGGRKIWAGPCYNHTIERICFSGQGREMSGVGGSGRKSKNGPTVSSANEKREKGKSTIQIRPQGDGSPRETHYANKAHRQSEGKTMKGGASTDRI